MTLPWQSIIESSNIRVECVLFVDDHPSQEEVLLSITNTVKEELARLGGSLISYAIKESSGLDPLTSSSKQLTISTTLQPRWPWEKKESPLVAQENSVNPENETGGPVEMHANVRIGVLLRSGGLWTDIPGTHLQARIVSTDTVGNLRIRKKPKGE